MTCHRRRSGYRILLVLSAETGNLLQPIRSTTQIKLVTRRYESSAVVRQSSFRTGNLRGGVAKYQARFAAAMQLRLTLYYICYRIDLMSLLKISRTLTSQLMDTHFQERRVCVDIRMPYLCSVFSHLAKSPAW